MQTCSRCNTESADTIITCPKCQADLREFSNTAVALKHFQENPRVTSITLVVHESCCPACQEIQGTYSKDKAPQLPVEGCSHEKGCRCFYQPMIEQVFP